MTANETKAITDRLDRQDEKLGEVVTGLAEIAGKQSALLAVCEIRFARVDDHETILHGPPANGNHPGLLTRMDRQENRMKNHEAATTKVNRVLWATYGAAGSAALGLGFVLFKAAFGL